jgi:hypothetical protein
MLQLESYELATLSEYSDGGAQSGERNLLVALLRQAFADLNEFNGRADPNSRIIFEAAAAWVFSPVATDSDDHLSFGRVCDLLGLDRSYIRRLARRMLEPDPSHLPRRAA